MWEYAYVAHLKSEIHRMQILSRLRRGVFAPDRRGTIVHCSDQAEGTPAPDGAVYLHRHSSPWYRKRLCDQRNNLSIQSIYSNIDTKGVYQTNGKQMVIENYR